MTEFKELSRGNPNKTKIMAGGTIFTLDQIETEMNMDSEIGRKLKKVEKELDKY